MLDVDTDGVGKGESRSTTHFGGGIGGREVEVAILMIDVVAGLLSELS